MDITPRAHAVGAFFLALQEHVILRHLGEVWLAPLDVVDDPGGPLVVQPDLFVILRGARGPVAQKVFGLPELVVEVLSPRPRTGDAGERLAWYRDHGVRECWVVHQLSGHVEVLHFKHGRMWLRTEHARTEPIKSGVLPEFGRSFMWIIGDPA